jgi:uncharacterized protein YuzB (UPF0349 family)
LKKLCEKDIFELISGGPITGEAEKLREKNIFGLISGGPILGEA